MRLLTRMLKCKCFFFFFSPIFCFLVAHSSSSPSSFFQVHEGMSRLDRHAFQEQRHDTQRSQTYLSHRRPESARSKESLRSGGKCSHKTSFWGGGSVMCVFSACCDDKLVPSNAESIVCGFHFSLVWAMHNFFFVFSCFRSFFFSFFLLLFCFMY